MDWLHNSIITLALAGALGGGVRWAALKDPWRQGTINIFIGAVSSVYMWQIGTGVLSTLFHPILAPDALITPEEGGFGIGLGGSFFIGFVIGTINGWASATRKDAP